MANAIGRLARRHLLGRTEVTNLPSGRPVLAFHGLAAIVAERLGVKNVSLSLTHTAEFGMAFLILEA